MNPFDNKTFKISEFKPFDILTVPGQTFCINSVISKLSAKTILSNPGSASMLGGILIMLSNEIVWLQNQLKKEKQEEQSRTIENNLKEQEKFKMESDTAIVQREILTKKLESLTKLKDIKKQNEELLENIKKLEQDSIFSPSWST